MERDDEDDSAVVFDPMPGERFFRVLDLTCTD